MAIDKELSWHNFIKNYRINYMIKHLNLTKKESSICKFHPIPQSDSSKHTTQIIPLLSISKKPITWILFMLQLAWSIFMKKHSIMTSAFTSKLMGMAPSSSIKAIWIGSKLSLRIDHNYKISKLARAINKYMMNSSISIISLNFMSCVAS